MAVDQITLKATTGRTLGTRPSRRLRREGVIPGVVYGHGTDPVSVAVEWADLRAALITDAGLNALITLDVDGDRKLTMVKEMQRHPVRRDVTHVDFLIVDRESALKVEVPIVLEAADDNHLIGLVVDQHLFHLAIEAKPGTIPNEFVVSVSALTADAPIRAGDIALPAGVALDIDPDTPVATAAGSSEARAEGDEADTAPEAADAAESDEAVADDVAEAESDDTAADEG